jgi:hypothetical protein
VSPIVDVKTMAKNSILDEYFRFTKNAASSNIEDIVNDEIVSNKNAKITDSAVSNMLDDISFVISTKTDPKKNNFNPSRLFMFGLMVFINIKC